MKLYDIGLAIIIFLSLVILIGVGSQEFLGKDNEVEEVSEEIVEKVIENELGVKVDLDFSN